MAGPSVANSKRKRRSAAPAPAPAPSRIRNAHQQKIIETVTGYDSVVSNSAALTVFLGIWTLVGAALVLVGMGAMFLGPQSEIGEMLISTYDALGYGVALLALVTAAVAMVWAVQAAANVTRIGRTLTIGQVPIVVRHVPALIVGAGLVALAPQVGSLEATLQVLGGVAIVWGLLLPASLGLGLLNALWVTSAIGPVADEKPNTEIKIWFVGICTFVAASAGREMLSDLSGQAHAFLAFTTGLGVVIAAVTAFRFVPLVATRQEQRIFAILNSFGADEPDASPVTAQQIQDAWDASSQLFSVDGH